MALLRLSWPTETSSHNFLRQFGQILPRLSTKALARLQERTLLCPQAMQNYYHPEYQVSVDQTGIIEDTNESLNPAVSLDQSGAIIQ